MSDSDAYGLVLVATSNAFTDYQKINSIGMGGCTGGEFRDQRVLYEGSSKNSDKQFQTGWYVRQHEKELNPIITRYVWPTLWWPSYVIDWQDLY